MISTPSLRISCVSADRLRFRGQVFCFVFSPYRMWGTELTCDRSNGKICLAQLKSFHTKADLSASDSSSAGLSVNFPIWLVAATLQISAVFRFVSVVSTQAVLTGPDAASAITLTTIIYPGLLSGLNQKLSMTCSNYVKKARPCSLRGFCLLALSLIHRYINTLYQC